MEEGCPIGVKDSNGQSVLHWAVEFDQVDLIDQFVKVGLDVNAENNDGRTPLHSAAANGNLESVRKLLESGGKASMTVVAGNGGTPLHEAVAKGHKDVVSVLLEEGCPIGVKDSDGESVLHWAVEFDQVDLIDQFVKVGLDVNAEDNDGRTPLHSAAANGNLESVRKLLESGGKASMTVVAGNGGTPLHEAVAKGHKDVVSVLLEEGCPIGVKDSNGQSVLHWAVEFDQVDLIDQFVKVGLDVNAENNDGRTPLHSAAANGNLESVRKLLESGGKASMTVVAGNGGTPLHEAVANGHKDVVSVLLEEGCPIGVKDSNGQSVLHWAVEFDQVDLIDQFVKVGLDVNAENNDGRTPLHSAAANGNLESVRKLLESGGKASMTVVAGNGGTPLHEAVAKGHKDVVSVLLEEGCPIGVKDSDGESVLHWAVEFDQVDLIDQFVKVGLDVNAEDNDGRTPLHSAAASGNLESVCKLLESGGKASMTVVAGTHGTPLHQAVAKGHKDVVSVLLEEGCPIGVKDSDGESVLHWAAGFDQVDLIDQFVKVGLDVNAEDNDGWTPLHSAAANGNLESVRKLLESGGKASMTVVAGNGGTPLHEAVAKGHKDVVSVLLEEGCPIGVKDSDGESVLHWAARFGQVDLIDQFVKVGLNVSAEDNDGWTPLHSAAVSGGLGAVRKLLSLGTWQESTTVVASRFVPTQSINHSSKHGTTPLLVAAMKLHVNTFIELKSHGGDIYLSDSFGLRFCDWCLLKQNKIDTINQFCEACGIKCDDKDFAGIISSLCAKKLFDINIVLCLAAITGDVNIFDAMVTSQYLLNQQWMPKVGLLLSVVHKNAEILSELHISSEPLNPLHIALLSVSMQKFYNHAFIEKLISHPRTRYTINEVFPNGLSPLDVARQLKLHNIADMIEGAGGGPGLWANLPKEIEQQCFYAFQAMRKLTGCESGHEAAVRILTDLGLQSPFVEGEQRDTTNKKILEEKPKIILIDRHVLSNLKNKGKWRRVGGLLEVDDNTLDRLVEESPDSDDAYYSMLKYWLKHGRNVTWKTLLDAVGHFETKKTVDDMTERIYEENTASNVSTE